MDNITVEFKNTKLILTDTALNYIIEKDGRCWINEGRDTYIVFQHKKGSSYEEVKLPLAAAASIKSEKSENKIISKFSGYKISDEIIPSVFIFTACITDDGCVDFSVEAECEQDYYFNSVYYPGAFNEKNADNEKCYSAEAYRQGFILPDNYPVNENEMDFLVSKPRQVNTGGCYMPVWGRVCGNYGFSAFAYESYDLSLLSCKGRNNALLTSCLWLGSLGKLSYKRILHTKFYKNCSYVSIAKDFRKQEKEKGNLITLDEKIKMNPNVAYLIGTPVIHWNLLEHNVKGSDIYKQTKVEERIHNTFDSTVDKFRDFQNAGLDRAYIHTDGWGNRGYDNLHPYILPPSDKIGGFEGMKKLSDFCDKTGYFFGLHDQYRDYYHDSPVYDKDKCVTDINGKAPYCDIWAGGAHNWLCSSFALQHVKRTYDELESEGIKIKGAYLDVFGIVAGDECYHPEHMLTRKQSVECRGECFDMLRKKGVIVSSEETGCQAVKYLDLVHHAPYAVTPQGGGEGFGIPVPLTNLVYHDCVFVPWITDGTGGWGIPDGDSGKMHCILNAQTPYFNKCMRECEEEKTPEELKARVLEVKEIAKINEMLYNKELINHEFLDSTYRVQRTTFEGGYQITVDFDKNTYKIEKI